MSDARRHLDIAAGWAAEAQAHMVPGTPYQDIQEPILKGQLEVLRSQIAATESLVRLVAQLEDTVAYPQRIVLSPVELGSRLDLLGYKKPSNPTESEE
jgi:hypothetical protein